MDLQTIRDICQVIYYVALSITGPVALFGFLSAKRKEQRQREEGTYHALDEKYLEFQKLCLQHPELDVFDIADQQKRTLSEQEKKQELIIFTMLFALFERAFLMYRGHTEHVRRAQWAGWEEFLEQYCRRDNYRRAWKVSGSTFDADFQRFMGEKMKKEDQAGRGSEGVQ